MYVFQMKSLKHTSFYLIDMCNWADLSLTINITQVQYYTNFVTHKSNITHI